MYNFLCLVTSIVSIFLIIGLSVDIHRHKEQNYGYLYLTYACYCLLEWSVSYSFYFSAVSSEVMIDWYIIRTIGFSLLPAILFLFSLEFNMINLYPALKKLVFIVPFITILLTFTNGIHHLIYTSIYVEQIMPIKEIIVINGPWSYISLIYSNTMYLLSLAIFAYKLNSHDENSVKKCVLIVLGFAIIIVFVILDFFGSFNKYAFSFFGPTVSMIIFHRAVLLYGIDDFSQIAKNTVFEKVSCIALCINTNNKVVEYNTKANEIFSYLNIDLTSIDYDELIKKWLNTSGGYIEAEDNESIIYIKRNGKNYYYKVLKSDITNDRHATLGTFVEFTDITKQQESIQELFRLVNTDQLTGLYNRRYYDSMCIKYDKITFYPLAVISGDLNKLKTTNDTYGHAYGDRLIWLIAHILVAAAPQRAVICRLGGDEFGILIPNSNHREIIGYVNTVDSLCIKYAEEPFGTPSISLGYAIKNNPHEPISSVIEKADKMMYDVKAEKHMFQF